MIHQHPLAYLVGLQGRALLRAFNGEYDRDFTEARLAEIRALLDAPELSGDGVSTPALTTADGYDVWAAHYDEPNDLLDMEQSAVRRILDGLPWASRSTRRAVPAGTPSTWPNADIR